MPEPDHKIRVLVAKPGLDGHDRGAKVIARALRDGGMEVIYTGIRQTPEMIVEAAIQEDVDAILMSILSGAHMALFPRVMELLKQSQVDDVLVAAGGILPDEDIPAIQAMGIKGCFGPGTPMEQIIGVTGSPGAGKSTLVTHLVREFRKREHRVGVIAIDPSSPFSGGAILGDRIRMMELAGDPDVFIRSMASRGSLGGLSASTRDV